jgi:hypothetical protein
LENLNIKIKEFLPKTLQYRCKVSSFISGTLTLIADDPVWTTELRYCLPSLRDNLRKSAGLYQLTSIKINMDPMGKVANKTKTKSSLSSAAVHALKKIKEICE